MLLFLMCLNNFKPCSILFHVPTQQIVMHCMQGKHLGMLFAVYSPQKCWAFLRVICGIVKEGWMNFVSKISLRFDDHTVSSFLHQCGRSREEQSTHLILKAQVVGEGKKKPFWSACSMAVGNHCRDGSWCILFDASEAVLPLLSLIQKAFRWFFAYSWKMWPSLKTSRN